MTDRWPTTEAIAEGLHRSMIEREGYGMDEAQAALTAAVERYGICTACGGPNIIRGWLGWETYPHAVGCEHGQAEGFAGDDDGSVYGTLGEPYGIDR